MDMRHTVNQLAGQHALSKEDRQRLLALSGLEHEPQGLKRSVPLGAALLGAALGGLGIIFWIAANWESLGRAGRFALLQAVVAVTCAGALLRPGARLPLSLLAMLATGGLFAYFGQTYQTGADPWQLFAIWAALTLPLCLGVRHDALWTAWSLVFITGVSLWIHAKTGHSWRVYPGDLAVHLAGWSAALLLAFAMSPLLARYTGAGPWALRVALTLVVCIVTAAAVKGSFYGGVSPHYWLGLIMLGGAAAAFARPRLFDIFALSEVCLGLNILLVTGLGRLLFRNSDTIFSLLLLGLGAAGLLTFTVKILLHVSHEHSLPGAAA